MSLVKTGLGPTKNGKKTAGKDFLSKGAFLIVIVFNVVLNHNETIQSQKQAYHEE